MNILSPQKKQVSIKDDNLQVDSFLAMKNKKSFTSTVNHLDQSFKQIGSHYSLSNKSKSAQQSHLQNQIFDIIGESAINHIKKNKEKNNQTLSFADMFFKIKFKSMARRLLGYTRSFMYRNLNIKQLKQIDDKSYVFDKNDQQLQGSSKMTNVLIKAGIRQSVSGLNPLTQMLKNEKKKSKSTCAIFRFFASNKVLQRLMKLFDRRFPVIDPISMQKIVWDFINIVMILIYTMQIPLFITFPELKLEYSQWAMIISVPIFIFVDLLYTVNTGCYQKGSLIKKRFLLLNLNLKNAIIPSLFIIVLYTIYIVLAKERCLNNDLTSRWLDILLAPLFSKLTDIGKIIDKLEEHQTISKKGRNIIALIKLILIIVYIGHIISCFWVMIAQFENSLNSRTWAKYPIFEKIKWYELYVDAYYFTTVTMITVGYGDIIPITVFEKTICVIIMIFSCGVFAYSMSTIGSILQSFNEDKAKLSQNMQVINLYMTRKNVGKQTRNQIREYLYYYWKEESERDQESEDKIINILSDNLKKNLLMESKNVVLKKSAIFRNNFSDEVKEKIVPLIKEYRCYPEEIICIEEELDDCSIYFIEKGSVEIFIEQKDNSTQGIKSICSLGKGQSFGETSFFTGKPRSASVRSREFTTLLILNRDQFLLILQKHQEDYEKFCALRDSLLLYENYLLIDVQCLSCKSYSHQILKCPYLHFTVNHTRLRETFIRYHPQDRSKYQRDNKKIVQQKANEYENNQSNCIEYQYLAEFYEEIQNQAEEDEIKSSVCYDQISFKENIITPIAQKENIVCPSIHSLDKYDNNKMTPSEKNTYQDDEQYDEVFLMQQSDRNFRFKDQLQVIKEICNTPLINDGTNKVYRSPQFLLDDKNVNTPNRRTRQVGNFQSYFEDDKNVNSPRRLRQGYFEDDKNVNSPRKTRQGTFQSYFEKQNTSDSTDNNRHKKNTIVSGKNDRSNFMNMTSSFGNSLEGANKKKLLITQPEMFSRQQSRKATIMSKPSKNTETFKKFLGQQTIEDFSNSNQKLSVIPEITKKQGRSERKITLFMQNKLNNNLQSSPPLTFQNMMYSSIPDKKNIPHYNSADIKHLSSSLQGNNLKDDQKSEIQAQQQNLEFNNREMGQLELEEVEDHFDSMQNFTYYFPLNNINYQIYLMRIDPSQKKQIMLRTYYENLNIMKAGNSILSNMNQNIKSAQSSLNRKSFFQKNPNLEHNNPEEKEAINKNIENLKINKLFNSSFKTLNNAIQKVNSIDRKEKSDLQANGSSLSSFQTSNFKSIQYRYSQNKVLEINKVNSLHNKPTNYTMTDHNLIEQQGSSNFNNNLKTREKDNDPQLQIPLQQQIEESIEISSVQLKEYISQQKSQDFSDQIKDRLKEEKEDEDEEEAQSYATSHLSQLERKNKDNWQTLFNDQQQNTLITFENTTQIHIKPFQQQQDKYFDSFQDGNFQSVRVKDIELEEIVSELDHSKSSINQSNFNVTRKRKKRLNFK